MFTNDHRRRDMLEVQSVRRFKITKIMSAGQTERRMPAIEPIEKMRRSRALKRGHSRCAKQRQNK